MLPFTLKGVIIEWIRHQNDGRLPPAIADGRVISGYLGHRASLIRASDALPALLDVQVILKPAIPGRHRKSLKIRRYPLSHHHQCVWCAARNFCSLATLYVCHFRRWHRRPYWGALLAELMQYRSKLPCGGSQHEVGESGVGWISKICTLVDRSSKHGLTIHCRTGFLKYGESHLTLREIGRSAREVSGVVIDRAFGAVGISLAK